MGYDPNIMVNREAPTPTAPDQGPQQGGRLRRVVDRLRTPTGVVTTGVIGLVTTYGLARTGIIDLSHVPLINHLPGLSGDAPPPDTGPDGHCWTLYNNAIDPNLTNPTHPMSSSDATQLVDCTDKNPGYFQQHTIPAVDQQGNPTPVIIGDRPEH